MSKIYPLKEKERYFKWMFFCVCVCVCECECVCVCVESMCEGV